MARRCVSRLHGQRLRDEPAGARPCVALAALCAGRWQASSADQCWCVRTRSGRMRDPKDYESRCWGGDSVVTTETAPLNSRCPSGRPDCARVLPDPDAALVGAASERGARRPRPGRMPSPMPTSRKLAGPGSLKWGASKKCACSGGGLAVVAPHTSGEVARWYWRRGAPVSLAPTSASSAAPDAGRVAGRMARPPPPPPGDTRCARPRASSGPPLWDLTCGRREEAPGAMRGGEQSVRLAAADHGAGASTCGPHADGLPPAARTASLLWRCVCGSFPPCRKAVPLR